MIHITLGALLQEYREGKRGLPTYEELSRLANLEISPRAASEPVAWRFREYDHEEKTHSSVWLLTTSRADMEVYRRYGAIIEPLYAAPVAAQPVQDKPQDVRRFRGVGELERTGYIPAGSATEREEEQDRGDSVCQEADGCPTEKAVLQRFWRAAQAAPAVPDGWMLVRIEPFTGTNYTHGEWSRRNWEAALEDQRSFTAAPSAPAVPMQAQEPIKDHVIAQTVNQLRDIAIQFHAAQQLRERIAHVIVPLLKSAPVAEPVAAQPQEAGQANTLGGFRGGFIGMNGRAPTEQEIWNAAVQSGMRRASQAAPDDLMREIQSLRENLQQGIMARGNLIERVRFLPEQGRYIEAAAAAIVLSELAAAPSAPAQGASE